MKKIGCVVSLLLCALFSLSLNSQQIAKQYFTKQINPQVAPKLDGFLDDSIWDKVEWGSNFVEVSPFVSGWQVSVETDNGTLTFDA